MQHRSTEETNRKFTTEVKLTVNSYRKETQRKQNIVKIITGKGMKEHTPKTNQTWELTYSKITKALYRLLVISLIRWNV